MGHIARVEKGVMGTSPTIRWSILRWSFSRCNQIHSYAREGSTPSRTSRAVR